MNEMLDRSNEMLDRSNEMLDMSNEMLNMSNEMLDMSNEMLDMSNEMGLVKLLHLFGKLVRWCNTKRPHARSWERFHRR
ncbi:hypothetical protein TNCV_3789321 [Trichonephila clavipes]|nr:hypothetical protein TNCV_3789321 [Trichonephila clavipes]